MVKKNNWFPLLSTSFLGILNDNFLKKIVSFVSIFWIAQGNDNQIIAIAGGLFIIPYLLFSPYAGYLAKTRLKRKIVVFTKIIEFPIMAIASLGFILDSIYLVMAAIFFMGLQSCINSPAKYGLVRDTGGKKNISFGIGALEMVSFLGNLVGAILAGFIADITNNKDVFIISLFFTFALIGWITSKYINPKETTPLPKQQTNHNPISFVIESIKWSRSIKGLNLIILGLSFFWLAAAMLEMNLIIHCPNVLDMPPSYTGLIIALVAVGIATGSFLSGILSNNKVELALVPIGSIGFAFNISLIYILEPSSTVFTILMMLGAFFAGLYKVPLNAFMQDRVEGRKLGDILAYSTFMLFLFILFASIFIFLIKDTYINFLIISVVIWLMAAIMIIFIPEVRTRLMIFLRIRKQ